jgi:alkylation response protein AidB-like acyl-CoA dehydrogenase
MPGRNRRGRDAMGVGLAALNRLAGVAVIDKLKLRGPIETAVFKGSRVGFRSVGVANRRFAAVQKRGKPERQHTSGDRGLFDLTPTDEQKMIVDATREFAAEKLRPAAAEADTECSAPDTILKQSVAELGVTLLGVPEALGGMGAERSATTSVLVAELGVTLLGVPEALGGMGAERSATTSVLVAEALAHGDMGLAVASLAPAGVSNALALWGDESQQATYLPSFVGDDVPAAALAVLEPRPLFDPFVLKTTATRSGKGFTLNGIKSLVPRAATAELFIVAAELDGAPALFIVESGTSGVLIEAEPAMGLRAAATGRLVLEDVSLPATALLGGAAAEVYADCIRLGRIGWAALALGTGRAVLDYVIPYVNQRQAFGEPISNRQAVAFMVADMGIELEGARLVTLRAASRADQGQSFAREAGLARRLTAEYGMQIGSNGVQLLGGHGYVKEHPVERWYRDLRAAGVMEGVVLV